MLLARLHGGGDVVLYPFDEAHQGIIANEMIIKVSGIYDQTVTKAEPYASDAEEDPQT
jgi:hypothetical protein